MTIQNIPGASFMCVPFHPLFPWNQLPTPVDNVVDAAAEAMIFIGNIILPAGSGSKTISSAGGAITFLTGACTFVNAGTNLRVGIQDVSLTAGPPARGDGTYDVRGDIVGGGGGITSTSFNTVAMGTGTKTITHGDAIALYIEMTTRGGVDSITVRAPFTTGTGALYPVLIAFQSAAYTWTGNTPNAYITFDDGTFGFFDCGWVSSTAALFSTLTYNTATTDDEACNIFQLPFPARVSGLYANVNVAGSSSNFELILYSDPLGTPVAMATVVVDANAVGITVNGRNVHVMLPTPQNIAANTNYAIAVRPTTVNSITLPYFQVSNMNHWYGTPMGPNCLYGGRINQTGPFTLDPFSRLFAGVRISAFEDGIPLLMGQASL